MLLIISSVCLLFSAAGDTLLPLSLPTERGWHSITQVGKYTLLFGGVRFKDHRAPEPFGAVVPPSDVECLSDLFVYDSDNVSWHKVSVLEASEGEGVNWPCGRYGKSVSVSLPLSLSLSASLSVSLSVSLTPSLPHWLTGCMIHVR